MDIRRRHYKNRRVHLLKKLGWAAGFAFSAALAVWGFFWIPYFRITNIVADDYVSGSELERTISPYMASLNKFWLPTNNYFLFEPKSVVELLKEKEIGIATAEKKFPKTLEVNFPETEPWLIYCADKCYYVSPAGFLTDTAPKFSENPLPMVSAGNEAKSIGDSVLTDAQIKFLKNALARFKNMGITVREVAIGEEIKFSTKENWNLLIGKDADLSKTFTDLGLLFSQKIKDDRANLEYIDMRFENKAFYKLRD